MENFKHELYDKHNAKGLKPPASTISTQLLVTNFFLVLTDLPMPDDLVIWF